MEWIYTNKSTPDELQRYLDDVLPVGAAAHTANGDTVEWVDGKPQVIAKIKGVDAPQAPRTVSFDKPRKKVGENGFFCLNVRYHYQDADFVDSLPNHEDYTGLYETDDISEWLPVEEV